MLHESAKVAMLKGEQGTCVRASALLATHTVDAAFLAALPSAERIER
jgi:hypothetical protein